MTFCDLVTIATLSPNLSEVEMVGIPKLICAHTEQSSSVKSFWHRPVSNSLCCDNGETSELQGRVYELVGGCVETCVS